MTGTPPQLSLLDRMVLAVERVRERLSRATGALESAGVPYAVAGGHAVAAWVATVDPAAVRNTQDVDILLRRADLDAARRALESVGYVYRHVSGIDMFLDGPDAKARDAVHVAFANYASSGSRDVAAGVTESSVLGMVRVPPLSSLVTMLLTSFRLNDRVDLQDMLDVGLVDSSWVARFPPQLGARLQLLIDTPEG